MSGRGGKKKECFNFKKNGFCRFGSNCKYSHEIDTPNVIQELFPRLEISSKPSANVKVGLDTEQQKQLRLFLKSYIPNEKRGVVPEKDSEESSEGSSDEDVKREDLDKILQAELENTYNHIPDSKFKRDFLENIIGNFRANKGSRTEVKCSIERNPGLDYQLKRTLCDKINQNQQYKKILEFRQKLPVFQSQDMILNMIDKNQVTLISGETGSGKTTQVTQFILDDYIMNNRGSLCHIVCTQPRRISAISVAERVAYERIMTCGNDGEVGYQIRLEKKLPRKQGSIIYCTTGILLQWLQSDPGLSKVSHIIIDETHERNADCDFVMTVLREVLPQRKDMKVILMSATLQAEKFSQYFSNCPIAKVPGSLFEVKTFYLEDVLSLTGYVPEPTRRPKRSNMSSEELNVFGDLIGSYVQSLLRECRYGDMVIRQLLNPASENIDLLLIQKLIEYICQKKGPGAILVFLPGWETISKLCRMLASSDFFCDPEQNQQPQHAEEDNDDDDLENDDEAEKRDTRILRGLLGQFLVLPVHSKMPTVNQTQVFDTPPPGVRKIIVSTNIAETSITIDDIVYIIDSGKMKVKNYDSEKNIATLRDEWVSKANAKQRQGRAGRLQPGECYHMFTKGRERILEDFPKPEIMRTRLEDLILTIKILQLGRVDRILGRTMDSPELKAVNASVKLLQTLRALDKDENLTPLGFHLAKLPLEPNIAKMILLSAIFSCVDPILCIAAALSFKEPFIMPAGDDKAVINKKIQFSERSKSDHLVLAEALQRFEKEKKYRKFCKSNFLSLYTLRSLRELKAEFAEHLFEMGFLQSKNPRDENANANSKNKSVLKAIICAGLYPNAAIVRCVERYAISGKTEVKLSTPEDGEVKLHRTSVNESQISFESPYLMYHTKMKSSHIFLHDTTMVASLPLILFSHKVKHDKQSKVITVNNNLMFHCDNDLANLVQELRQEVQKVMDKLFIQPGAVDWNSNHQDTQILRAAVDLITKEDVRSVAGPSHT